MYPFLLWTIIILNLAIFITIAYGLQRIPGGLLKSLFFIFFFSAMVWANLLLMIQIVPARQSLSVSYVAYLLGFLSILTGGLFMLQFAGRLQSEVSRIRFWLIVSLFAMNFLTIRWMNSAIGTNAIGLRYVIQGPIYYYLLLSWSLWFGYIASILVHTYMIESRDPVRYQYQYVLSISLASVLPLVVAILFNHILQNYLPGIYFGAVAILIFVFGLLRLLANQQYLYLKSSLRKTLRAESRHNQPHQQPITRAYFQAIENKDGTNSTGILIFQYEHLLNEIERIADPITRQFIRHNRPGASQSRAAT